MLGLSVALLILEASAVLHFEPPEELEPEVARRIVDRLATAIELETGDRPSIDQVPTPMCRALPQSCAGEIRARTGHSEVVVVGIFAGLTKTRLTTLRVSPNGQSVEGSVDLPEEGTESRTRLMELARRLFPDRARSNVVTEAEVEVLEGGGSSGAISVVSWVLLGGGVAAAAVGTGYGLSSGSARSTLIENRGLSQSDIAGLTGTMESHALVANVLFAAAAGAGIAALVGFLLD